jgi:hypothetical protein
MTKHKPKHKRKKNIAKQTPKSGKSLGRISLVRAVVLVAAAALCLNIFLESNGTKLSQPQSIDVPTVNDLAVPVSSATELPVEIPVDITAKFIIYINGEYRVFSSAMYQNQSPDAFIPPTDTFAVRVTNQNVT